MLHWLRFLLSIILYPETQWPRANYPSLSLDCLLFCVRYIWIHTFLTPFLSAKRCVCNVCECEKVSCVRKPTRIGYRAELRGRLGHRLRGEDTERERCGLTATSTQRPALCWCRRVIPLPQVRGWTGECSHYGERWALSVPWPSNLFNVSFKHISLQGNVHKQLWLFKCGYTVHELLQWTFSSTVKPLTSVWLQVFDKNTIGYILYIMYCMPWVISVSALQSSKPLWCPRSLP